MASFFITPKTTDRRRQRSVVTSVSAKKSNQQQQQQQQQQQLVEATPEEIEVMKCQYSAYRKMPKRYLSYERLHFVSLPEEYLPVGIHQSHLGLANYWPALVYDTYAELIRDCPQTMSGNEKAKLAVEYVKNPKRSVARLLAWNENEEDEEDEEENVNPTRNFFPQTKLHLIQFEDSSTIIDFIDNVDEMERTITELLLLQSQNHCDTTPDSSSSRDMIRHIRQLEAAIAMAYSFIALDIDSDSLMILPPTRRKAKIERGGDDEVFSDGEVDTTFKFNNASLITPIGRDVTTLKTNEETETTNKAEIVNEGGAADAGPEVSIEMEEHMRQVKFKAFITVCQSLMQNALFHVKSIWKVHGSEAAIHDALKNQIDELAFDERCYYEKYHSLTKFFNQHMELHKRWVPTTMQEAKQASTTTNDKETLNKLEKSDISSCHFGMNPIHILACWSVHSLASYCDTVDMYYSDSYFILKESWGEVPLLYVMRGNAPTDIVQFVVRSYNYLYPDRVFNWNEMLFALSATNSSVETIQNLLDIQQDFCPRQSIDWDQVLMELAEFPSCYSCNALCFLSTCSIAKRVKNIGIRLWRNLIERDLMCPIVCYGANDMHEWLTAIRAKLGGSHHSHDIIDDSPENSIESFNSSDDDSYERKRWLTSIQRRLAYYETEYQKLKEVSALLEFALWKAKFDESILGQIDQQHKRKRIKLSPPELCNDLTVPDLLLSSSGRQNKIQLRGPCDVLRVLIFPFLDYQDLVKPICKLWTELAGCNQLWKSLYEHHFGIISTRNLPAPIHWKELFCSTANEPYVRMQCRINCGANLVIDNVLPFLLPRYVHPHDKEEDRGDD
jgi:hypothetical protein